MTVIELIEILKKENPKAVVYGAACGGNGKVTEVNRRNFSYESQEVVEIETDS